MHLFAYVLIGVCVWTLQQSMMVPSTPLHTTRVLTEDREMWEDVKVSSTTTSTPSGHILTLQLVNDRLLKRSAFGRVSVNVAVVYRPVWGKTPKILNW